MNINDLLGQVLVAILQLGGVALIGFIAALARVVYKQLDIKLGVDRTNLLKTWIASAVQAAEQSILNNPDKKAAAIEWVQKLCDAHGIKVDVSELDMLVESAIALGLHKPDATSEVVPGKG